MHFVLVLMMATGHSLASDHLEASDPALSASPTFTQYEMSVVEAWFAHSGLAGEAC